MSHFIHTIDPAKRTPGRRHYWYAGTLLAGGVAHRAGRSGDQSFGAGMGLALMLSLPFWLVVAVLSLR